MTGRAAYAGIRWIYVIEEISDQPAVKIGIAREPHWRLWDLQIGNYRPLRLVEAWQVKQEHARHFERVIHAKIAPHLIRGEWFSVSAEEAVAVCKSVIGD